LIEARRFGVHAGAIAATLGDSSLQAVANYYAGAACFASTDYRDAEGFLRTSLHVLEGELSRERFGLAGFPAVMARWLLASSLAELGEFAEGSVHGQEGLRIAEELRHPYSLILMCWGLALLHALKGETSQASLHLERALALCRDWTVPVLSPVTTGFLGYVHVLSGRFAEGLPLLQHGKKDAESSGLTLYHSRLTLWLGEAFMRVDQLEDALAQGERALRLTQERGERGLEAWARWLLGEVASRRETPDVEGTAGQYRQALALADDLALRPLAARCHDGLGKLYGRAGQRPEATAHLVTATTMYRTMSMSVWLEQAEAVLTALS
jgi:tetratricopeptide (TPR) repeat protein